MIANAVIVLNIQCEKYIVLPPPIEEMDEVLGVYYYRSMSAMKMISQNTIAGSQKESVQSP